MRFSLSQPRAHHFDRDSAAEIDVRGTQHDAHATLAQHAFNAVLVGEQVTLAEIAAAQAARSLRTRHGGGFDRSRGRSGGHDVLRGCRASSMPDLNIPKPPYLRNFYEAGCHTRRASRGDRSRVVGYAAKVHRSTSERGGREGA